MSSIEQKTNFLAAYVSAGLSAQLPQLMSQLGIKPRDSFEVGFNRATGLAAVGDMEAAETAVKAAYKQGKCKIRVCEATGLVRCVARVGPPTMVGLCIRPPPPVPGVVAG